ncbi:MAG: ATP synthase F1 subunit delta [Deltaproteobacteria bacterium]|nr:ATP synthase F1 subunit delta [Deltaproteobacteria bacterium]
MKSSRARRFAKALIEIAREDKAHAEYGRELRTALAIFKGTPELYKALLNPMYRIEERLSIMELVSGSLKLSPHVAKFLNVLVQTRNIRILEEVSSAYSRLEDELSGRLRVILESPDALDNSLLEEIKKKLSASTGKEIAVSYRNNPALIGGLVIKIDNTILDGSLKTQLQLMKEKILEGVV